MAKVTLTNFTSPKAIVDAARVCYNSNIKASEVTDKKLLTHLVKNNESPLEFSNFTFYIEGISRIASHQLVRHRIASYAQKSQIYCKEKGPSFYIPKAIKDNEQLVSAYDQLANMCFSMYEQFKQAGISNDDARYILPQAVYSNILVTMNVRSLLNFLYLRTINEKQASEIIDIANQIKEIIRNQDDWCKLLIEAWEESNEC